MEPVISFSLRVAKWRPGVIPALAAGSLRLVLLGSRVALGICELRRLGSLTSRRAGLRSFTSGWRRPAVPAEARAARSDPFRAIAAPACTEVWGQTCAIVGLEPPVVAACFALPSCSSYVFHFVTQGRVVQHGALIFAEDTGAPPVSARAGVAASVLLPCCTERRRRHIHEIRARSSKAARRRRRGGAPWIQVFVEGDRHGVVSVKMGVAIWHRPWGNLLGRHSKLSRGNLRTGRHVLPDLDVR